MFTNEEKRKIKEEMEYREEITRQLESLRPRGFWDKLRKFFGHALVVALFSGALIHYYAVKEQETNRKQQWQEKQYTLLANFSDEFDQYIALLENVRWEQNFLKRCETNKLEKDFIGRSKVEVMPFYAEIVKQMHERPRGEGVLASVRALYHSSEVTDQVNALDDEVLKMQYGDPGDGKLNDKQITSMEKDIDQRVRKLAVAMRQELEANK